MIRSTPPEAAKRERVTQIVGPVTDHDDVRHVDAEEPQLLGQPGPVAVEHPPGQNLGARHHDRPRESPIEQS